MPTAAYNTTPESNAAVWSGRVFSADVDAVRRNFGVRSFALHNKLANHPLFTPARLALAGERALASGRADRLVIAGCAGDAGARFEHMTPRPKLADSIAELGKANSWIKLSTVSQYDPDYADLREDALADIREMLGNPPDFRVSYAQLTVFMASPNIVTPYHIDHEANFLSQITGATKTVCVFPPDDRDLLPCAEIETFYVADINGARYRQHMQSRGTEYAMRPGMTIHHPPLAPHWVKNGDDVSISLSLNFCMPPLERRARVYQVNYYLRRLGFDPPEPRAGFPDSLKSGLLQFFSVRKPKTYRDTVFSGLDRLRKPFNFARRVRDRLFGKQ